MTRSEEAPASAGGEPGARRGRRLAVLGLPTFGMALAVTGVSTLVPVLARSFHASSLAIGLIVAVEGLMALWVPVLAGSRSDRLRTRLGGRLPFVLVGTPVMVGCLLGFGLVGSLAFLGVLVAVFFFGYFLAYEPYRALYPDLVEERAASRSQSAQAVSRGLGTGLALLSGGVLLGAGRVLPFAIYAGILAASVALFTALMLKGGYSEERPGGREDASSGRRAFAHVNRLLREHRDLRHFVVANMLWELSLAAIKTFVVLYVTAGLGFSLTEASGLIGGVALIVLVGAAASGTLADRHGRLTVMEGGLWVYGVAILVPGLFADPAAVAVAVPFIALGGGVLMSLPYSLLMPLMPSDEHGVLTGLYSLSRGIGVMLGPLLAGLAIELGRPLFTATEGYSAAWLVAGAAVLLSIPLLRTLRH